MESEVVDFIETLSEDPKELLQEPKMTCDGVNMRTGHSGKFLNQVWQVCNQRFYC